MLGDALLVTPVLAPGVDQVEGYLPAGHWHLLWEGPVKPRAVQEGPARVHFGAPLGEVPVHLAAGHVVAMQVWWCAAGSVCMLLVVCWLWTTHLCVLLCTSVYCCAPLCTVVHQCVLSSSMHSRLLCTSTPTHSQTPPLPACRPRQPPLLVCVPPHCSWWWPCHPWTPPPCQSHAVQHPGCRPCVRPRMQRYLQWPLQPATRVGWLTPPPRAIGSKQTQGACPPRLHAGRHILMAVTSQRC